MADEWDVNADPQRPKAALEFFRSKRPVTKAEFYRLSYEAQQRAFTVSAAARLDQVNDVMKSLDSAIANGESFAKFKRSVSDKLGQAWGKRGFALEAVFRINTQQAYNVSRWHEITHPDAKAGRPIGRFNALEDGRLCPTCAECDGVTLPLDDMWWQSHNPALHALCRCEIETLRVDEVPEKGMTSEEDLPGDVAAAGWGRPVELSGFQPDLTTKDRDAAAIYTERLQSDSETTPRANWEEIK